MSYTYLGLKLIDHFGAGLSLMIVIFFGLSTFIVLRLFVFNDPIMDDVNWAFSLQGTCFVAMVAAILLRLPVHERVKDKD